MPAKQKKQPEPEAPPEASANSVLRKAYTTATQQLRDAHRQEFEDLYTAAAKELGIDRKPRQTAEQKAEEEFDALLAEYPHLRERCASGESEPEEPEEEQEGATEGPGEGEQ
jgi:hypothetical protein